MSTPQYTTGVENFQELFSRTPELFTNVLKLVWNISEITVEVLCKEVPPVPFNAPLTEESTLTSVKYSKKLFEKHPSLFQ